MKACVADCYLDCDSVWFTGTAGWSWLQSCIPFFIFPIGNLIKVAPLLSFNLLLHLHFLIWFRVSFYYFSCIIHIHCCAIRLTCDFLQIQFNSV